MDEIISDIIDRGLKLARLYGTDGAEIYGVKELTTTVRGDRRGVKNIVKGDKLVVGIRVAIGKRVVTQGGVISKISDLDYIFGKAVKIAKTLPEDNRWSSLPDKLGRSDAVVVVADEVRYPDLGQIRELSNYIVKGVNDLDRRAFVSDVLINLTYFSRFIGNSFGISLGESGTRAIVSVNVKAVDNGHESGYTDHYVGTTLKKFEPADLISKVTEVAIKTLIAKRIPTGIYEVILTPKVFKYVFEDLIIPALCADQIQRNRSPLKGKLGLDVFSEELTVFDDGIYPSMVGTKGFDDEGIPTRRKCLIERGVVRSFLYDSYTANIDRCESTGNAFRPTPSHSPSPWRSNIIVNPGSDDLTSLTRGIRKGLIVYDVIGMWLSNPINGLLNATVSNAILVEDGLDKHPVKGVIISGNIYELLANDGISLTARAEHYGSYALPYIYVPKVSVAGI
ncbi:MAG: metallopeptidase TldD-related protein [Sulfolobales archaeon]|nr:TldD/PmbA family protein [Sulfolobales archaeon]MDW7969716.1 metallopeptidase TldD-related protein [Sulfolobales archaeon]